MSDQTHQAHDIPARVLWLDLETTDSEPEDGVILELGAIITDWSPELRELASATMLIRPPGNSQDHTTMWYTVPPEVKAMHLANGLWAEATTSADAWSIHDADSAFAGWCREHSEGERMPIAGSGVGHLDLPFVKAWMPATASLLKYWPVDIGNYRRMLKLAGREDLLDEQTDVHSKPHRALADVQLHVTEARKYLATLAGIPRLESV